MKKIYFLIIIFVYSTVNFSCMPNSLAKFEERQKNTKNPKINVNGVWNVRGVWAKGWGEKMKLTQTGSKITGTMGKYKLIGYVNGSKVHLASKSSPGHSRIPLWIVLEPKRDNKLEGLYFTRKLRSQKIILTGNNIKFLDKIGNVNIILWDIRSEPEGAKVKWRIISSAQGVKNTRYKSLGKTPIETTEVLDIKGLNKYNQKKVQIEIRLKKKKFHTVKKRIDIQDVINKKEISETFKLKKK